MSRGLVVAFDQHAGFGTVRDEHGNHYFFHCTAVADGSRTIPVGTAVTFGIVSGHNGRWEASAITPT